MGVKESNTDSNSLRLMRVKRLLVFSCLFLLVYAAMMALWPVWGKAYVKCYRIGAAVIFESSHAKRFVRLHPSEKAGTEMKISFHHRERLDRYGRPATLLMIRNDIHHGVYIYLAFTVALVTATPIPLKRRAWAVLWGMLLIHIFFVFRLSLLILHIFSSEPLSLLDLGAFWKKVLLVNTQVFTVNVIPSYVVAVFIWILISLRQKDWHRILMQKEAVSLCRD